MARTRNRRLAVPVLGLLIALASTGCAGPAPGPSGRSAGPGSPTSGTATSGTATSGTAAPGTASPGPGSPATATPTAGSPGTCGPGAGPLTVTEADNGATVCTATGATVTVVLHGTADRRWSPPVPDNALLRPIETGRGALQVGVSAGYFVATGPGQARITAQMAACPSPTHGVACGAIELFTVTVTIH